MKSRLWLIVAAVALSGTLGCRAPQGQEELETELRHDEDKNYQLVAWIQQYHDLLEACRRENAALREKLGAEDKSSPPPAARLFPSPAPNGPAAPPELPQIEIPKVEIPGSESSPGPVSDHDAPGPAIPTPVRPRTGAQRDGNSRLIVPRPAADLPLENSAPEALPDGRGVSWNSLEPSSEPALSTHEPTHPVDNKLSRITLNRMLTTGFSGRRAQGDKGVRVVVEPRNAADELVRPAGELSIIVLDPTLVGAEARVARWDFTAKETARHYRRTPLADGIQLDLTWPGRHPLHSRLRLYARLTTPDGRQLMVDRAINVMLPARNSAVPRSFAVRNPAPTAKTLTAKTVRGVVEPTESVPVGPPQSSVLAVHPEILPPTRSAAAMPAPPAPAAAQGWSASSMVSPPESARASVAPRHVAPRAAPPDPAEAVSIPVEPGSATQSVKPPDSPAQTAERMPQWAPYR